MKIIPILFSSLLVLGGCASYPEPVRVADETGWTLSTTAAAAVIDRIGMEGKVIRSTAVIAVLMVLAVALLTFLFLALGL